MMKNNFLKFKTKNNHSGFTLIELLVVISIIGILAAISLVSFTSAQRQARDTQRKSDLKQYSTALEGFANANNGLYPAHITTTLLPTGNNPLCTDLGLEKCPGEVKTSDPSYGYKYVSDGTVGTTATKYVLWGRLEADSNYYWAVCSSGKSGKYPYGQTDSVKGACPI